MKKKLLLMKANKTFGAVLLLLTVLLLPHNLFSQQKKPFVENFTQKEYGSDCHTINASLTEANGLMYFGNNTKVLEFDGINWVNINITANSNYILSVQKGVDNRVYVGAFNEFGYLDIDDEGQEKYFSLSDTFKKEGENIGSVWKVFLLDSSIVFFTEKKIFFYKDNKFQTLMPKGGDGESFHNAFVVDNQLFVRQRKLGLLEYSEGNLKLINGGEKFKDIGVFGIVSFDSNYLIITQEEGLFMYRPRATGGIGELQSKDTEKLVSYRIQGAVQLSDGNIALNTQMNGLIVINSQAKVLHEFNQKTGLLSNDINQAVQDEYGNVWLATANGISRLDYASAISLYNEKSGLMGSVQVVKRYNDKLYVGTTGGLFVQTNLDANYYFKKIESVNRAVADLCVAGNDLFVGTKEGLIKISSEGDIEKLADIDARRLLYIDEQSLLSVVGLNGLFLYEYTNKWLLKNTNNEIAANVISFESNREEASITFWVGTVSMGVFKVNVSDNYKIEYEWYIGVEDGLDDSWTRIFNYKNQIFFSTISGVKVFKTVEEIKASVAEEFRNEIVRGGFDNYFNFKVDSFSVIQNMQQSGHKSFVILENELMSIDSLGDFKNEIFLPVGYQNNNNLYVENDSVLWISANEGLIAFEIKNNYNLSQQPRIFLRQVKSVNDSVFYSATDLNVLEKEISFEYKNNSILFSFSDLYQNNGLGVSYSYKLEGYDETWSEWTSNRTAQYQKIHEGNYTFKLKAKSIYGIESDILEYTVVVLTPWYRSVFAFFVYVIIFLVFVVLLIRVYTARLKAKNIQLEKIVEERTVEIVKQKDEILHIHKELTDSINYAERIQLAVLPSKELINEALEEHFIMFKPKDVVSGDFYWAYRVKDMLIITVADCTGHGVPGAFMSMLGMSFLNEIVNKSDVVTAAQVLNLLREKVIYALKQKGIAGEQKDGMDMSLCAINLKTNEVQWSGANNPLYIISENEITLDSEKTSIKIFEDKLIEVEGKTLYELKPDKMPVAHFLVMDEFKNHTIKLSKGDQIYMFSDGYPDQFGGPKGKKYKYKPFKRLIVNSSCKSMAEQGDILDKSVEEWKAFTDPTVDKEYEQIDDICLIGIKL